MKFPLQVAQRIRSAIIHEGKSRLDGGPIVVVATGLDQSSQNVKTGAMVQTYILRSDLSPLDAIREGLDHSVCGDCVHRKGSCYVNVGQGPTAVYAALTKGSYPTLDPLRLASGLFVRLGAYGDPCAVPLSVWDRLLRGAADHSGYTHQWRKPFAQPYKRLLMASVDTEEERYEAMSLGWRTFRVKTPAERRMPGEIVCPASAEAGYKKTCAECLACDGSHGAADRRASVVIDVHGLSWKHARFEKNRK